VTSSGSYYKKDAEANMLITISVIKTWNVKIHNIFKSHKIDRNVDLGHSDVLQYNNDKPPWLSVLSYSILVL